MRKKIKNDSLFCPECGAKLNSKNPEVKEGALPGSGSVSTNNAAVNSETKSASGKGISQWVQNWTNSLKTDSRKRKQVIIIASAVLAIVILIIILCCTLGGREENGKPKSQTNLNHQEIDVSDFVTFYGYNGEGTMNADLNLEKIGLNPYGNEYLEDFEDELKDEYIIRYRTTDKNGNEEWDGPNGVDKLKNGDEFEFQLFRRDNYPIEEKPEVYGYTLKNTTFKKKVSGLLPNPDPQNINNSELVSLSKKMLQSIMETKPDNRDKVYYDTDTKEYFYPENETRTHYLKFADLSTFRLSKQEAYLTTRPTSFGKRYSGSDMDKFRRKNSLLICHYTGKIATGETIDIFAIADPIISNNGKILNEKYGFGHTSIYGVGGILYLSLYDTGPEEKNYNLYNIRIDVNAEVFSNQRANENDMKTIEDSNHEKAEMLSLFQKLPAEGARQVKF